MADAHTISAAISGALVMGYATAALFFAKSRRRTGAPVFGWFAVAFVLLAVQRAMLLVTAPDAARDVPWSYVVRLLAFVLILIGIVAQNRGPRWRRGGR